jgi:hypothetical protein
MPVKKRLRMLVYLPNLLKNLAGTAAAPRSTRYAEGRLRQRVSDGMNASERTIPPDCNPTSDALGKRSGG